MPGLTLAFAGLILVARAVAAIDIGRYLCGGNDDDRTPPRDSYYSSSSSNRSATTRIQTQPSYRPPLPSPSYRPPATYAQTRTTPKIPAPPDYGRGVHHSSAVSPCTRTPSQTQPSSSTRAQPSVAQSTWSCSPVPSRVPTERDPLLPTLSRGVYRSGVVSPYTHSETQPSATRTHPSSTHTQQSSTLAQPSSAGTRTRSSHPHPSLSNHVFAQSASTSSHVPTEQPAAPAPPPPPPLPPAPVPTPVARPAPLEEGFPDGWELSYDSPGRSHHVDYDTRRTTSTRPPSCVPSTERDSLLPTVIEVVSSDLGSDESANVEDLDFAKKLREQARRRGREMSDARSRAKSAHKKRYGGAAQVHRQEAISHESAMKELDKRAARIIFRENNKNRKEGGKIDLHGLYVAEAVQFAKDQVQTARSRGDEVVRFIVGKGLHSDAGAAKIRPALEDHFTKRGLIHSLDPKNAGVLIVRLV